MTPTLLIIFNRPEKTQRLMDALTKIRPSQIYISADGPRTNVPTDAVRCAEARKIAQNISWPCTIKTNFSDTNLGCKKGVSSAIKWFFSQVPSGIILEDDCVPSPSFFPFCAELLERYKNDNRIMHIGGTTFLEPTETSTPNDSYHFSKIPHIWGWATWKRAWDLYDIEMRDIDNLDRSDRTAFKKPSHAQFWINLFKHVRDKKIDTWDAQWVYSITKNKGLSITPTVNLIENIGFDTEATHTQKRNHLAGVAQDTNIPLTHPMRVEIDLFADEKLMKKAYIRSAWQKLGALIGFKK